MAFCMNCGEELQDGMNFCPSCGVPVVGRKSDSHDVRKQEYAGKIIKCPVCGETLASFQTVCPTCGHEIRGTGASTIAQQFSKQLDAISAEENSNPTTRKKKSAKELEADEQRRKERKIEFIKSFPIPNTKEDITEFMIMAASNVKAEFEEDDVSLAWRSKFEQAYQKAKMSFGTQPDFGGVESLYRQKRKEFSSKKRKSVVKYCIIIICICVLPWAFIINGLNGKQKAVDNENARLQLILDEINECIGNEDYKKAKALTSKLVFTVSNGTTMADDAKENWEKTRVELYAVIERAETGESITDVLSPNNTAESTDKVDTSDSSTTDEPSTEKEFGDGMVDAIESGVGITPANKNRKAIERGRN